MSDESGIKDNAEDGDKVAKDGKNDTKNETDTEKTEYTGTESQPRENKPRSVSFNRDVHVKRFGKPRDSRGSSAETVVRKEPFTHLSEQELIDEANKVLAQAENITCTADHPPEKFFSLPHRRKFKEKEERRNSEDGIFPEKGKTPLERSTSDVGSKRRERTSLSTLFRRAQKEKEKKENPPSIIVTSTGSNTKPVIVKRSKSDVSDLKSNTNLNPLSKPIRKRSGSETEEFLKSLRNKKTQLSPIIESSPRDDYFKKTSPLDLFQKQKLAQKDSVKSDNPDSLKSPVSNVSTNIKKVNPVEKPPRYKVPENPEPKPPKRTKRGKSQEKDKENSPITETPKRKIDIKKKLLVDEIDTFKAKDPIEVKDRIKDSIRKIEENIYGDKEMIHSSQQPPDKPPLTRGHTVDHIVRFLKEDQQSPSPKAHLILPPNGTTNVNQPFSYIKPSVSPDPNLFARNPSPDRVPTPVNTMAGKGVVYAHVVRDHGETGSNIGKQTIHKTYSPPRDKYNQSDEDEGLGFEERRKYIPNKFGYDYRNDEHDNFNSLEGPKVTDSPIRPRFREYKLTSFDDFEPTYANEYPLAKDRSHDYIDSFRGRADGMDTKRKTSETDNKLDLDFNELSHRRQLLESRLNARRYERERNPGEPVSRYLAETDPIYEAEKRMKATEKYVNETAKYIHRTIERDGLAKTNTTEVYNRYNSDNHKIKYIDETENFSKVPGGELEKREFIDTMEPKFNKGGQKHFPPEPEYEPPSLEFNTGKPILSPDEYTEKKYKLKKQYTSSHDIVQTGKKYNGNDWFGKRKGHYASNPEIAHEREEDYINIRNDAKQAEMYHNSLRRVKNKDKYREDYGLRRHDSGDSRYYYRDNRSPRRYDIDNRLVDSGIENDFRKDSSGEINRRFRRFESDDDVRNTSLFLDNERRHTEDNFPCEQIYANGEYMARFRDRDEGYRKEYGSREKSVDEGSHLEPKRYEKSPLDDKVSAKPPKVKKLSGLEKMKQLFSRDSSKKSKKREEKEPQPKTRTRVLKSPEHLAGDDSEYRRYTDPEPSDIEIVKKKEYKLEECCEDGRFRSSRENLERHRSPRDDDRHRSSAEESDRQRSSREDLSRPRSSRETLSRPKGSKENLIRPRNSREDLRHRSSREDLDRQKSSREDLRYKTSDDLRYRSSNPRESNIEKKYRETDFDGKYERTKEDRWYKDHKEERRYHSSDRESDQRASEGDPDRRKNRSRATHLDSPALAERYRERRRLATPSPSPPRRAAPAPTTAGNWFKSLDRLARKKKTKDTTIEKESVITTEDESTRKAWSKTSKPLGSPAKNLRFFGDTDQDSDANVKQAVSKSKSHPQTKPHSTLRKTVSNSSTGLDEVDHLKSYSMTNLKEDSPRTKQFYKRNLQNISEIHSNSETESQLDRRAMKPPISPYDRSRSHSSSKTLKGSKGDLRRYKNEDRGSSSELRSSKQELRDLKHRRRTPAPHSGESSTEGDSSHQSQRSVVYLHATTVGDIPDPGHISRNRSRDDVSSVNSSNLQVRNTTKSFSIFAPWTPRHYNDQHDVHYSQRMRKSKSKEPVKKAPSTKNLSEDKPSLQKNKSYSQTTLTRKPQNNRLTSSSTTLYRKPEKRSRESSSVQGATLRKTVTREKKSQSNEVLNRDSDRERLSRSVSMPKDKKAGWFKLTNKTKKQENTRVR